MTLERGRTFLDRMTAWSPPKISINALKLIGAVLTALYFFSIAVVQNGILHIFDYTDQQQLIDLFAQNEEAAMWGNVSTILFLAGMVGMPIFAYLLVQGVEHTSNIQRYILTVFVFAVVSEPLYDLAMFNRPWSWAEQNSLWTVFISLVMLWLMKTFQSRGTGIVPVLLNIVFLAAGCFMAMLIRCKFGGGFVLMVAILYLLRERKNVSYWVGALEGLLYYSAPLGFIPVALCSGVRREKGKWSKYAYYAFYPIMMAVFALCVRFI